MVSYAFIVFKYITWNINVSLKSGLDWALLKDVFARPISCPFVFTKTNFMYESGALPPANCLWKRSFFSFKHFRGIDEDKLYFIRKVR